MFLVIGQLLLQKIVFEYNAYMNTAKTKLPFVLCCTTINRNVLHIYRTVFIDNERTACY